MGSTSLATIAGGSTAALLFRRVAPPPLSFLLRFVRGTGPDRGEAGGETDTIRRIAARLERLPAERARFLAAFSFVLARVAHADLHISETESAAMEAAVAEVAGLPAEETALAVEIAKGQARLLGGTENYVVTREFRRLSDRDERARLVGCLYAVAAADGTISRAESSEIARIAEELGFLPEEAVALRAPWRDKLSELQGLPKTR
jgi:uncharacterized tellurite resistance protein B-like protein